MEINTKGGAALYAMQKAIQQPQQMLDHLQKSGNTAQTLAAPPTDGDGADNEIPEMTGKGQIINIKV